jgi:flagellar biosynthesis chaperone FliJ
MGFFAHEVQEIFPFLVTGEKDGEHMQSMNYNGFIALLVKEVQDLKKENTSLKSQLDSIFDRLAALEA